MQRAHYTPPWANMSIMGIAGSSGSGKTSLALAIVQQLNLPWVIILSMDSFYKVLTPEQSELAFKNEYDFDSPDAIDFDLLVQMLGELRDGKKVEAPIYSFEKHGRIEKTHSIYSPHVLILEGIFALHDQRVLEMLDLKIFADADADVCLARRPCKQVVRDVRERGRDIEGCIKQWFSFVKPNFQRFVDPQRQVADIIVPRGIENKAAIGIVSDHIHKTLTWKSKMHQAELKRLGKVAEDAPHSDHIIKLVRTNQVMGIETIILDPLTDREDFIFYFDRMAGLLIERAVEHMPFIPHKVETPQNRSYLGLKPSGEVSAVVILRGGTTLETGLKRVLPDCRMGRILIQTSYRTSEPELHYRSLPDDIESHSRVLLLDSQMSSGGAALMAVKVLVDHGVKEENIIFVTYFAGKMGVNRLLSVFPDIHVVVCRLVDDMESRWFEEKYLGC